MRVRYESDVVFQGVDVLELLPEDRAALYREDLERRAVLERMAELRARWSWFLRFPAPLIALLTQTSLLLRPPEEASDGER